MWFLTVFTKYNRGLVIALSAALALTIRVERGRVTAARQQASSVALAASNVAAERDSTRMLARATSALASMLGDSVRLYERRIVQAAGERNALDAALHAATGDAQIAKYELQATTDSLNRTVAAAQSGEANDGRQDVRRADFVVRQPPYTLQARAEIPPPPDSARLSVRVALDPIHVAAHVLCATPDRNGIRAASVVASTPSWATITFDRLEQSPDLCASPALIRTARSRRLLEFEPVVIGGGRVIRPDGVGSWGFFVGSGVRVWM
jgi:hypothetical protein